MSVVSEICAKKREGERLRLKHQIENARGLLDGLASCLEDDLPCSQTAQSVADASVRLVAAAARHDVHLYGEGE